MKRLLIYSVSLLLLVNVNAFSAEKRGILDKIEGGLDKIFGKEIETKTDVKLKKKDKNSKNKILKNETSKNQTIP